jgi:hypothetical protein
MTSRPILYNCTPESPAGKRWFSTASEVSLKVLVVPSSVHEGRGANGRGLSEKQTPLLWQHPDALTMLAPANNTVMLIQYISTIVLQQCHSSWQEARAPAGQLELPGKEAQQHVIAEDSILTAVVAA